MTERHSSTGDTTCPYRHIGDDPAYGAWWLERLTGREKEVLLLLGAGLGNRELARELGIGERTVKAHIARIVEKLGQRTRLQAAVVSVIAHDVLCGDPHCTRHPAAATMRREPSAA